MLKKTLLTLVAMMMLGVTAFAGDDLLSDVASLQSDEITDAQIAVEDLGDDALDVDALASKAGEETKADALEACFRWRGCGYGGFGCGYGYGYSCYSPCYYSCYSPCYYYTYRPCYTYSCVTYPVCHSYWGCY